MTQANHTPVPATQPAAIQDPNMLVGVLVSKIKDGLIRPDGPDCQAILEWLASQDSDVVKKAIKATQPPHKGYAVVVEPLVDSISDDQARGVLMALMAVYVQVLP